MANINVTVKKKGFLELEPNVTINCILVGLVASFGSSTMIDYYQGPLRQNRIYELFLFERSNF